MAVVTLPAWETAQGVAAQPAGRYAGRWAGRRAQEVCDYGMWIPCQLAGDGWSSRRQPASSTAGRQAGRQAGRAAAGANLRGPLRWH